VWRGSGRLKQSVTESSFDAWTKYYRQDENAANAIVSYYNKGALVALALDITIRQRTQGSKSLDDVMRALWQRNGRTGTGVEEDGIERIACEITGLDLKEFFDRALRGTTDLPIAELLAHVGVTFSLRPAESDADKGGKPAAKSDAQLLQRAVLGARLAEGAEARLAAVFDDGAAQAAGLSAGDVLVAFNSIKVTRAGLDKLLRAARPGERVHMHAFRRDELLEFDVLLQPPANDTAVFQLVPEAAAPAVAQRRAWLQPA
jgi:predicted metalloprotease with PDZ domain